MASDPDLWVPGRKQDRRRFPRAPSQLAVWYHSPDLEIEGNASDLSIKGMFLESDFLDAEGTPVEVLLDHYLLDGPVEISGRVVHISHPENRERAGMGIELVSMPERAAEFLRRYGSNFERRRVLMVDDEVEILRLLNEWIDRAGHKFVGVQSAFHSIETILKFRPHVLVLDVMMPGLPGPQLCRLIRSTPSLGHMPVMLYSAMPGHDLENIALGCGADAWVQKGARASEVVRKIEQLLEEAPLRVSANS